MRDDIRRLEMLCKEFTRSRMTMSLMWYEYSKALFRCFKNQKFFKILHHIESCYTCMKY